MKKKLIIAVPVLLLAVVGAVYKLVLAPKPKPAPPAKVQGVLVPLANEFVVNLAGGHYGKVSVALLMLLTALYDANAGDPESCLK